MGMIDTITPIEVRWLIAMDNAWLSQISIESQAKRDRDKERAETEANKGARRR